MAKIIVNLLQSTGTKGGLEIYARELYSQFGQMETGHEFVGYASKELVKKGAPWFPGRLVDSGISGENRVAWAWGELLRVSRFAAREKADLIHGPAMLGPLRSTTPVVISFHDVLYFTHPHLMQTKLFTEPVKWMEKRAAANSTRIITISKVSARAIERHLHVNPDRIDLIPLAGRATKPAGVVKARADDLFLAIGQRSPYKDLPTVVRAWSHIPAEQRPRLVITGSFGDDPLIPLVRELGLESWVELKSWIPTEELGELFSTATALIDPTLAAGFGMPAIEAMMIGLPVILSDTEVFREVGADAVDYFHAGDPVDLARAVVELASNPQRRKELSQLGLTRSTGFSWHKVANETLVSFDLAMSQAAAAKSGRRG
ncbi:MAG: glycosyltransferase family 1 protein [Rhodoglobus sp.]